MAAPRMAETSDMPFWEQLRTLGFVYWVANAMEMFERLAYYGLRTVLPVFMLLAVEEGGPQFNNVQKGEIFALWAAVQSFVPIVSGGFADRYGYKLTVAVSIAIKIAGYLLMAFALPLAGAVTGGASVGVPGHPAVYGLFTAGALLLALGTAVFKPGVQGLIASGIHAGNNSLAWGLFYQCVNLGGFLGPILAGVMRLLSWTWVFVACAGIVALNYLLLLVFAEPEKEAGATGTSDSMLRVAYRSATDILEPRLFGFLAVFSGFWAMFYQLFDLLPNFIEDWVDSSGVYQALAVPLFQLFGSAPPDAWGGRVPQEMMINLNAGLIMLFAFAVGYVTGRVRSMTAMVAGIVVSAIGILLLGTTSGWAVLGAIALFSFGEMMASPTKIRYFTELAPPGRKGLYLGYTNATTGIGWSLGSLIAGTMYEEGGDKVALARRHLVSTLGESADAVEALPKTEVLSTLAARLGTSVPDAEALLWATYDPTHIWRYFALIGVVSMVGLIVYDQLTRRDIAREGSGIVALTAVVTGVCYGWQVGLGFLALGALGLFLHGERPKAA